MATTVTQDELQTTKLGYASSISGTTASGSTVDIPGCSIAVTVPNGGRSVKVSFSVIINPASTSSSTTIFVVKDGTTIWNGNWAASGNFGYSQVASGFIIDGSPTAGSHTYKLQIGAAAGTTQTTPVGTAMNQILVELI